MHIFHVCHQLRYALFLNIKSFIKKSYLIENEMRLRLLYRTYSLINSFYYLNLTVLFSFQLSEMNLSKIWQSFFVFFSKLPWWQAKICLLFMLLHICVNSWVIMNLCLFLILIFLQIFFNPFQFYFFIKYFILFLFYFDILFNPFHLYDT